MDTAIVLKNNEKPIIIPHSDWHLGNSTDVLVVDEIDKEQIIGNFNYNNLSGVYTINEVRTKSYDDMLKGDDNNE